VRSNTRHDIKISLEKNKSLRPCLLLSYFHPKGFEDTRAFGVHPIPAVLSNTLPKNALIYGEFSIGKNKRIYEDISGLSPLNRFSKQTIGIFQNLKEFLPSLKYIESKQCLMVRYSSTILINADV
jgi:hypothetical protein